jgi:hypothetical protein
MTKEICEISASSLFYYNEICYDAARSHERKNPDVNIRLKSSGFYMTWQVILRVGKGFIGILETRRISL